MIFRMEEIPKNKIETTEKEDTVEADKLEADYGEGLETKKGEKTWLEEGKKRGKSWLVEGMGILPVCDKCHEALMKEQDGPAWKKTKTWQIGNVRTSNDCRRCGESADE